MKGRNLVLPSVLDFYQVSVSRSSEGHSHWRNEIDCFVPMYTELTGLVSYRKGLGYLWSMLIASVVRRTAWMFSFLSFNRKWLIDLLTDSMTVLYDIHLQWCTEWRHVSITSMEIAIFLKPNGVTVFDNPHQYSLDSLLTHPKDGNDNVFTRVCSFTWGGGGVYSMVSDPRSCPGGGGGGVIVII